MNFPPRPGDAVKTAAYLQRSFGPVVDPALIEDWPPILHEVLKEFGPVKVWDAGFPANSFPATWCRSNAEVQRILNWLRA